MALAFASMGQKLGQMVWSDAEPQVGFQCECECKGVCVCVCVCVYLIELFIICLSNGVFTVIV